MTPRYNSEVIERESERILSEVTQSSFDLHVFSLDTLYKKKFPDLEWLVDGLIPEHSRIAFAGQPESFKSFIAQHIAIAVSQGSPVFDRFQTKKSRVLIIDLENHEQIISERMHLLGAEPSKELMISVNSDFSLEKDICVKTVVQLIQKYSIKLVIFDSLIRMHESKEDDSVAMAGVTKTFKRFIDSGASVIFIHHEKKSDAQSPNAQSMRGSSEIRAAVDLQYGFKADDNTVTITQFKNRLRRKTSPIVVHVEQDGASIRFLFRGEKEDQPKHTDEDIEQAAEEILSDTSNLNYETFIKKLTDCGLPKQRVIKTITRLKKIGIIEAIPSGNKNEKFYIWVGDHSNHSTSLGAEPLERLSHSEQTVGGMTESEIQDALHFGNGGDA